MNYQLLVDILWYSGHILTSITLIINHYNFYNGIICVCVSQFMIIISRPIGRINNIENIISDDTV
jgi:hypothetical protein